MTTTYGAMGKSGRGLWQREFLLRSCPVSRGIPHGWWVALGGSHVYPTGPPEYRNSARFFHLLEERSTKPVYAIANRRIFNRDGCEVWALSPSDEECSKRS